MGEFVTLLAAPFVGCLLIASLHCYMGLHVVRRGVIFVDLALAQLAALGAAVALIVVPMLFGAPLHEDHDVAAQYEAQASSPESAAPAEAASQAGGIREWMMDKTPYALSLLFAFAGAAILSVARFRDETVPHEAIIGIVFVVSAALAVLVLSRAPHGEEQMEAMLVGSILFVNWTDALAMLALYLPLGILHYLVRRRILLISEDLKSAESSGVRVRAWDFLFYATFGLMVTQSVRMAGVLVVFSYLIIPAVCASLLVKRFYARLLLAWGVALAASIAGLAYSAANDMPTGPSLVAAFAAILLVCAAVRAAKRWIGGAAAIGGG